MRKPVYFNHKPDIQAKPQTKIPLVPVVPAQYDVLHTKVFDNYT